MPSGHLLDDFKPLQWLSAGWDQLRNGAHNALTRFRKEPGQTAGDMDTHTWGLLVADMVDNGDRLSVRLEIPGLNKQQLHVELDGNQLIVSGEKRYEGSRKEGQVIINQCAFGHFQRVMALPAEVDATRTRADYKDGVLTIDLPKIAASNRRVVEIG